MCNTSDRVMNVRRLSVHEGCTLVHEGYLWCTTTLKLALLKVTPSLVVVGCLVWLVICLHFATALSSCLHEGVIPMVLSRIVKGTLTTGILGASSYLLWERSSLCPIPA